MKIVINIQYGNKLNKSWAQKVLVSLLYIFIRCLSIKFKTKI